MNRRHIAVIATLAAIAIGLPVGLPLLLSPKLGTIVPPPSPRKPGIPINTSVPTISGTAAQGFVLTETHGLWSRDPRIFAYQWQDCDASGNSCASISNATGQTYRIASTDVGHTIRVKETASNYAVSAMIVQQGSATGNGTSVTVTLSHPVTAGNLILLESSTYSDIAGDIPTPTGYSTTTGGGFACPSANCGVKDFWKLASGSEGNTFTVSHTGSGGIGLNVVELEAAAGSTPIDISAHSSGSSITNLTSASAAPSTTASFLFANLETKGANVTFANTWTSGFTQDAILNSHAEYAHLSTNLTSGITTNEGWGASRDAVMLVVVAETSTASNSATSAQTAVIGGQGSSNFGPTCSPSPCTTPVAQTYTISANDGAGGTVNWSYTVWRPGNLVNDSTHLAPLVFAGITFTAQSSWISHAASKKYVYVEMDPTTAQPNYAMPAISRDPTTTGVSTCGPSGTAHCDDVYVIEAILASLECNGAAPCQNIDTSQVYVTGASKGGVIPEGMMCDERTSTLASGYGIDSNTLIGAGVDSSTPPNCPALNQGCKWAPSCSGSINKDLSVMWVFGSADTSFVSATCSTDCIETGFVSNASTYEFGIAQEIGYQSPNLFGTYMGCPSSPSTNQTFGNTSQLNRQYFAPCSNSPDPTLSALGFVKATGGGHVPQNYDGLDTPTELWNFWQAFPA